MAAINFPGNPGIGTIFTNVRSGYSYQWDGTVWNSYSPASVSNVQYIDDIAPSFNGLTQTFALASNGIPVRPGGAQSLLVSIAGVVQEPFVDYTVSNSNIIFSTPPSGGFFFFAISYGSAFPITQFALANNVATEGDFNVSGRLNVSGITSAAQFVGNGSGLTGIVTSITAGSGISVNQSTGNVTITATGGGGSSQFVTTAAGIHTLSNVGIGTTNPTSALTVKGNTSLETLSVSGVSTFAGITTVTGTTFTNQLSVSGVSTFNSNIRTNGSNIKLGDGNEGIGNQIKLGNGSGSLDSYGDSADLWIYHNASFGKNWIQDITSSGVEVLTGEFKVKDSSNSNTGIIVNSTFGTEIYYSNSKKFETLGAGVTVTGTTFTNQLSVSGSVGIGTTNPTDKLTVRGGDISVGINTSQGLILTSPNGTRFRLIVGNDGSLSTVAV